jgi:hypothetical protein
MCNAMSLLVDNPIARYATRPERPGFVIDRDGVVTITPAAELPHGVPEASWLPAPRDVFRLGAGAVARVAVLPGRNRQRCIQRRPNGARNQEARVARHRALA